MTPGFLGAFLGRAAAEPDRVLITLWDDGSPRDLTHAGLVAGARRWARALRMAGGRPGDIVLIALRLSDDLLHAFLGALLAGRVPSFMPCPSAKQDPALFWSSHDALFGRLGGGVIVTSRETAEAVRANITKAAMVIVTPEDAARENVGDVEDEPALLHPWREDDVACLQHSSGTTGLKKGVMLRFSTIAAQISTYADVLGLGAGDTIVSWLPLYHDMGFVACFLMPLTVGARVVMIDPFAWLVDPLTLFDLVARYRGTFVWLPNFAFNHLVNAAFDDERRADLRSLRAVIDCSEPCVAESLMAFARRFEPWGLDAKAVTTCYAMAETVFAITQAPLGEVPKVIVVDRARLEAGTVAEIAPGAPTGVALVSAGHPLPGVALAILDARDETLSEARVGRIAVNAPFVFAGYHLDPERSATAFRAGFFHTGDLGFRLGPDVFVLGRDDDLLIVLGRNVFANEIETILGALKGLKPGRVLAMGLRNDEIGSQDLVILAEPDGTGRDETSLRKEIRWRLESIIGMVPRTIAFVDQGWLVKSTSGKISRNANRLKYLAELARSSGRAGKERIENT